MTPPSLATDATHLYLRRQGPTARVVGADRPAARGPPRAAGGGELEQAWPQGTQALAADDTTLSVQTDGIWAVPSDESAARRICCTPPPSTRRVRSAASERLRCPMHR